MSFKKMISYIIGFILSVMLFYFISQALVYLSNHANYKLEVDDVFLKLGTLISLVLVGVGIGRHIMTFPHHITIGGIGLPNYLYDPDFEKNFLAADYKLLKENEALRQENEKIKVLLNEVYKHNEDYGKLVNDLEYTCDIFIRHHNNTSRLIRNLLQLWREGKGTWLWEFCGNVLDECVTTLTKDRADKSSSIYFINNNILEMYAYNRIDFSSSRERKFNYGQGFAGSIWSSNAPEIVQDVSLDERFKGEFTPGHDYGSILGYPIRTGKEFSGVLCIQSKIKNGFEDDDLIMVSFYADICGLAKLCDLTKISGRGWNLSG
ncbi:MAG: GAF domain-containing protein [Eubacteriales bacterium]